MVTVFTFGNDHVQSQLKELFCSYVECEDAEAELVDADFFFVDNRMDSVSVLAEGQKYNLILIDSFYKSHSGLIRLMPGFGSMKNDSISTVTLSIWRQGKKVKTLNKCISGADEKLEEFDGFTGLNMPRYDSLEELRNELNLAIVDEFHAGDLGSSGLKFQFLLPEKSGLSGEYEMRLEFLFHSGKRISKRRRILFLP